VKLYEIPVIANEIEAQLAENYGELTPETERAIADFLKDSKEKIESAAMIVKSLEADAEICRQEAERLMARAQGLFKGEDRLKGLILFAVDEGFGGKIKTAKFTIWGQTSGVTTSFDLKPGADIYTLASAAPQFIRTKDPELDRQALRDAHKAELPLPDCITVMEHPGTRYLRIL
jgi:hypothetical protein